MQVELTEAVWLDESGAVSLVQLAQTSGLTEAELRDLVEWGALEPLDQNSTEWNFGSQCISAARTARRLRTDFELEPPALALVLSLLERVQELEAELKHVQANFPRMPRR